MINFSPDARGRFLGGIFAPDVNLTGRRAAESLRTRAPKIRLKIAPDWPCRRE